jgi:hypothetical protein
MGDRHRGKRDVHRKSDGKLYALGQIPVERSQRGERVGIR